MDFTSEERAYIDEQLRIADEMQARNENKLYPFEEVKKRFLKEFNLQNYNKEVDSYKVRNL